ncbi:hypothetical protein Kpol_2001p41 [Vanderwaltozyma polyspora DSM 70294]|uniref:Protein ATP12, mitochondrial n=1 Tax=Vanderwaltozyma polyspora (strain ATCC 22028 / DSM 70294 / BCRC 21397 / CBS 2163 / NBRC 10782 / NRRL Y-8283 / UCD 57-17) TaxID=436907 RepID=A7TGS3_VANPO|nr:uncharacterized protein Kpol_2001p41 [Vanderwaltozyma polyspora DSM 70294]EDO18536.1 hypothetical protein Kpol_2001p41 [Vanderwaltozyma polyspora DSM 70294]
MSSMLGRYSKSVYNFNKLKVVWKVRNYHVSSIVLKSAATATNDTGTAQPFGIDTTIENNKKTETNRLSKTLTKFWDKVSYHYDETSGKYLIQLDSKTINTPMGNLLAVDKNKKMLALMLSNEWKNLPNLSIKKYSLPLTSLTSRCIDLEAVNKNGNLDDIVKFNGDRNKIINDLLRYLDTDTLLVFSPASEFEGALRKEQNKLYLPVIDSIENFLTEFANDPIKLNILDADIHGLRGNQQDLNTKEAAKKYLESLSYWDLAIFEKIVLTTKSFICGILLLQGKSNSVNKLALEYNVEDIVRYATLETIHQVDRWGEVEDTHDVDKRDIRRNVNAAAVVAYNA